MPNDFESLQALAERRPKPPNPLKIGKRNITAAWPVMQTAKYVDETNAYIDSLLARLLEEVRERMSRAALEKQ